MARLSSLAHTRWDGKYHLVWIPKYGKKQLFGQLCREIGPVLRSLANQRECEIREGHLLVDQVHRLITVPPKDAVSQVVGYIKGKSAIHIARTYMGRRRNCQGQHFWACGYYVSTVGIEEAVIWV